jgi:hypothetical protein
LPTIHLSLPEWIYDELKRKAEEMGVQITDLVKFFIRRGIEGDFKENVEGEKLSERVEKLEEEVAFLSAKVAQMDSILFELMKKVKLLEISEEEDEEVEMLKTEK